MLSPFFGIVQPPDLTCALTKSRGQGKLTSSQPTQLPSYHNLLPTTGTCSYHQPQPDTNEHCQIQYGTTQPGLHGHIDWTMPGREMADGGEKKPQTIKHQV